MKKLFWVGIGVGVGVLAARKVATVKQGLGREGLNRSVGRLADAMTTSAEAFRDGMHGREAELRTALGLDDPQADAPTHRR
ncbi:MAG: hypothetical protein L0J68_10990 [Micrococcaceae bacterium]|nr:hypothetical protein [Micrococcaceae bacterium]MDN5813772.1 hypothetical protein [Micrococcaceae bacterium]MDN5823780.1 hypothetical protein [Micrococcaceae bacterium]MDN5879969.1 hypothetical protein [Micrococcaceae bacterium]MDN5887385.1 hypothetical protein [Micrococcaceae bacterium]